MAQEVPEFVEKCQVKPIASEKKKAEKNGEKVESSTSEQPKASGSKTAAKSFQADSASKDSGETAMVPEQFLTKDVTLTLKTTAGDIPVKLTAIIEKAKSTAGAIVARRATNAPLPPLCPQVTILSTIVSKTPDRSSSRR